MRQGLDDNKFNQDRRDHGERIIRTDESKLKTPLSHCFLGIDQCVTHLTSDQTGYPLSFLYELPFIC